mgnify:CR=1 FL=1
MKPSGHQNAGTVLLQSMAKCFLLRLCLFFYYIVPVPNHISEFTAVNIDFNIQIHTFIAGLYSYQIKYRTVSLIYLIF